MTFYDKFYELNKSDFTKVRKLLKNLSKNRSSQETLDKIISYGFTKDEIETYIEMEYMS